jgi:15-cis-phytoene synthase
MLLDQQVRRVDEDRWLASRFAPADVRARLIALYALNDEIARTTEVVKQAILADIRLAWWREAIAEIYQGNPVRAHPVLEAFAAARGDWPQAAFEALIEARAHDLGGAPSDTVVALEDYIDATAGSVMRLALQACGVVGAESFVAEAAKAWGLTVWLRAGRPLPSGETQASVNARARARYEAARVLAKDLPAEAFPAIGYVALVPGYLRTIARGERERPLLLRQLRLVAAAATGAL